MKFIIVNGLPGTGKTTIAKLMSTELGIPLIAKDTIKEFLFDELGVKDRAWSKTLGKASNEFLYELMDVMLMDGQSLMIESAFEKSFAKPRLQKIIDKYKPSVLEVYCSTDPVIRKQRFVNRNESGVRHQGHADHKNYEANAGPEPYDKYAPLEVGFVMRIDTSADIDIKEIVKAVGLLS